MGAGGCPVVVAEWQSTGCTSHVSWVRFPVTASLFTFLYFRLITSKSFIPTWGRLFYNSDITYCNIINWRRPSIWGNVQKTKLSRSRWHNTGRLQEVFEQEVCISELANWQCKVSVLQISSKIVPESLWAWQIFHNLWIIIPQCSEASK